MDGDALKGDDPLFLEDPETSERVPIDRDVIRRTIRENEQLIWLFIDMTSGLVRIPLSDYKLLPAAFLQAYRLFTEAKAAKKGEEEAKIMRKLRT